MEPRERSDKVGGGVFPASGASAEEAERLGAGETTGWTGDGIMRRLGVGGTTLKLIAVVTMIADHIGAALVEIGALSALNETAMSAVMATPEGLRWMQIDYILRMIGRISFPIFCFLLVEGFCHTRDVKKYGGRLLIFAFISEIPFDLAFCGSWWAPEAQNIFFTLFIGLCAMTALKRYEKKPPAQLAAVVLGCGAALLLRTDYDCFGVFMICVFYELRERKMLRTAAVGCMVFWETAWRSYFYGAGLLSLAPICLYNGQRGRLKLKYFFYWFYPVHLLLLYGLRCLL